MKLKQWLIRTALKFNLFTKEPEVVESGFLTEEQVTKKLIREIKDTKEYQRWKEKKSK